MLREIKILHKNKAAEFIVDRHYSPVMPSLTRYYCGYFIDDELQGVITFGYGVRPQHTIKKLFPTLEAKDYLEIGKMCMDDSMGKNSETQMLSLAFAWLKQKEPNLKYLYTWADGIVGKPGDVYQAFNFLYGGYIMTDTYVSSKGEKIHPRTMQKYMPHRKEGLKIGSRPDFETRKELKFTRVKGKQFRYILPMSKKDRRFLKHSTVEWSLNYPKDKDLIWKVLAPGKTEYETTTKKPFNISKTVEYNRHNIDKYKSKNNLDDFFA